MCHILWRAMKRIYRHCERRESHHILLMPHSFGTQLVKTIGPKAKFWFGFALLGAFFQRVSSRGPLPFCSSCLALVQFASLAVVAVNRFLRLSFAACLSLARPQGSPLISHPLAQLSNFFYLSGNKDTPDSAPLSSGLFTAFISFCFSFILPLLKAK